MKKIILTSILLSTAIALVAQTSVVQDAKGETTLSNPERVVLSLNAKESSISFSTPLNSNTTVQGFDIVDSGFGLEGKVNAKKNVGKIFSKSDFKIDSEFGGYYFWHRGINVTNPAGGASVNNFFISAKLISSQFRVYQSTNAFDDQVFDDSQLGWKVNFGYDGYGSDSWAQFLPNNWLLGIGVNFGQSTNISDLKTVEIFNSTTIINGTVTRVIKSDADEAFRFEELDLEQWFLNWNMDMGNHIWGDRILALFHHRLSWSEGSKVTWNPAGGLYVTPDGSPLEIVTGLQFQLIDAFDARDNDNGLIDRLAINVVAGYNF